MCRRLADAPDELEYFRRLQGAQAAGIIQKADVTWITPKWLQRAPVVSCQIGACLNRRVRVGDDSGDAGVRAHRWPPVAAGSGRQAGRVS